MVLISLALSDLQYGYSPVVLVDVSCHGSQRQSNQRNGRGNGEGADKAQEKPHQTRAAQHQLHNGGQHQVSLNLERKDY